ncbi:6479_t:CDS:1, partial [Rhizophagus irregularis]
MTKITNIHNRSLHGHLTKAIWHVNNDALKAWEIVFVSGYSKSGCINGYL